VKNRFQNLPFKCNLQRYVEAKLLHEETVALASEAGLYRLNQFDPHLTHSLKVPAFNP
jgi:hypothetical protein